MLGSLCLFLFMLLSTCARHASGLTERIVHHKLCPGLQCTVLQACMGMAARAAHGTRAPAPTPMPCGARSRSRVRAGAHAPHLVAAAAAAAAKAAAAAAAQAAGGQCACGRCSGRVVRGRWRVALHGLACPAGASRQAVALRRSMGAVTAGRHALDCPELDFMWPCTTTGPRAGTCGRYQRTPSFQLQLQGMVLADRCRRPGTRGCSADATEAAEAAEAAAAGAPCCRRTPGAAWRGSSGSPSSAARPCLASSARCARSRTSPLMAPRIQSFTGALAGAGRSALLGR